MQKNSGPFVITILALAVISVVLPGFSGRSKENRKPSSFNYREERIASITDRVNNQTAAFSYDAQKRLSRIDYNYDGTSSIRFKYTLPTIIAQYYNGAVPDITREKYVFTLFNGNIVNTRMTNPDGTFYDVYLDYDANERMKEVGVRGISRNGVNLIFNMDAYFSYPQDNTQLVKLYAARGAATDSVVFARTYDLQTHYFDFINIGFNYFGSFSTGIAYKVAGLNDVIAPFPFFKSRLLTAVAAGMIPALHPIKTLKGEGKARDIADFNNNGWKPINWDSEFNDTYYRYDEMGRVTEEGGRYQFTWQ